MAWGARGAGGRQDGPGHILGRTDTHTDRNFLRNVMMGNK